MEAKELMAKEGDFFCKCIFEKEQKTSGTYKKSTNPKWEESYDLWVIIHHWNNIQCTYNSFFQRYKWSPCFTAVCRSLCESEKRTQVFRQSSSAIGKCKRRCCSWSMVQGRKARKETTFWFVSLHPRKVGVCSTSTRVCKLLIDIS